MKRKHSQDDHFPAVIETIILFAILLVILHTIFEDLAVVMNWSHSTVVALAVAGLFFDLLFSGEFLGRTIVSIRRGKGEFTDYFLYRRGWIDALSSVPLLLFVSLPTVIVYLFADTGGGASLGFLSILKTAKAIRVTRVLRLIRVIKIFGKIQNTDSVMTNRHVGIISTISVIALIFVLILSHLIPFLSTSNHDEHYQSKVSELELLVSGKPKPKFLEEFIAGAPGLADVVELKSPKDKVIFEHPRKDDLLWRSYEGGGYIDIGSGYSVILSYQTADAIEAKTNLIIFFCILTIIISMMFFYSSIFAQQVADPAFVIHKGFAHWDYNLEARINPHFEDDEIFRVAKMYNIKWLPLKNQIKRFREKNQNEAEQKSNISLDDVLG